MQRTDPRALALRIELAQADRTAASAEALRKSRPRTGYGAARIAGGVVVYSGESSPLTRAIALGMNEAVTPDQLDEVEAFLSRRGGSRRIELLPFAHETLQELLAQRGYQAIGRLLVLVRSIERGEEFAVSRGEIEVRPAKDGEERIWARAVCQGMVGRDDVADEAVELILAAASANGSSRVLALVSGEPAGGAALGVHDGVATLLNASVRPSFRGRGLHQQLIRARLALARDLGCSLATSSTPSWTVAQRNLDREGFRVAYTKVLMVKGESRS